jgi:hypothetical protein
MGNDMRRALRWVPCSKGIASVAQAIMENHVKSS